MSLIQVLRLFILYDETILNQLEFINTIQFYAFGLGQILQLHFEICLVGFYGISTFVGYLMPNLLYTYISNIYDLV